jgi:hypothetical protein
MLKTCSIATVVGFLGFWVFGFLALTGDLTEGLNVVYILLAFAGLTLGTLSYFRLCRLSPKTNKKV